MEASDGYIYAGTRPNGYVFKTNDWGGTWTNTSALTGATDIFSLLEASDGYIYAASGIGNGDVFRTNDGGGTWTSTAELTGATIVGYGIIEASDGYIYAGTYPNGDVFRTNDRGDTWTNTPEVGGSTNVLCLLEASDDKIYAGTSPSGDVYKTDDVVSLIELISFDANPHRSEILVVWETASEIDNEGFHLWRAKEGEAEYTRITSAVIPSEGGPIWGASYEYVDEDVTEGQTYFYKLEAIDIYGISSFHGPVEVMMVELGCFIGVVI